ncbi:hypothetical protein C8R47DRAFT_923728, partial [Mycena vitilis]
AQAVLVNATIDDTTGDSLTGAFVTYTPPDAWNSGATCGNACAVKPDISKLNGGTWHDSTFSFNGGPHPNVPLSATVSFNGSAVYVFCAMSRSSVSPPGAVDITFLLDGVAVDGYTEPAMGSAGFEYDVPMFAKESLPSGMHTLTVQNGRQGGSTSLMILDSIVYTYV